MRFDDVDYGPAGDQLDDFESLNKSVRLRGLLYMVIGFAVVAGFVALVSVINFSSVANIFMFIVVVFGLGGIVKGLLELVTGVGWRDVDERWRIAYIVLMLLVVPILVVFLLIVLLR